MFTQDHQGFNFDVEEEAMTKNDVSEKLKTSAEHWGKRLGQSLKEKGVSRRAAARYLNVAASVIDSWAKGASPSDLKAVK